MKKKIVGVIIILVGIITISIPFLSEKIIKNKSSNINLEEIDYKVLEENNAKDASFSVETIDDVDNVSSFKLLLDDKDLDNEYIIGYVFVPSINMELPIYKGVTETNLFKGAVTLKDGQNMGEGNFAIAGHYMKNPELLFGGLMDIEMDSEIYLFDGKYIYTYKVYEDKVVPDDSLHLVRDDESEEKGKPIVSLMTCYYSSKSNKRYFVVGELIDKVEYKK